MDPPEPDAPKDRWRAWARRILAGSDLEGISTRVVAHLAEWEQLRGCVLTYLPMQDEVDLTALPDLVQEATFVVSRTPPSGLLTLHHLPGELERHVHGFLQPLEGTPEVAADRIDVALVPGLAFDRSGVRLGRGGGHFDRFLAQLPPGAIRVGVTCRSLVVPRLPRRPHDVLVTHLVTQDGVRPV